MTSHASRRPAHPGRSSSFYRFMSKNTYNKRPFSLSEQMDKLESKGLLFDDKKEADIRNFCSVPRTTQDILRYQNTYIHPYASQYGFKAS